MSDFNELDAFKIFDFKSIIMNFIKALVSLIYNYL